MNIEPGQTWEYDLLRPEDAEGVASLFRLTYGEGYPVRHFIEPDLLGQENAALRVVSSVARTPRGDIVGHNALFQSAPCAGLRESGAGVVPPAYRGVAGIFKGMCQHGEVFLNQQMQGQGLHCEPVCNHVFSQKLCHGLSWLSFAVEVDLMPASAYTQEKSAEGLVTTLVGFRTLRSRPHRVYLPARFDRQIRAMYANQDDSREFATAEEAPPPAGADTRVVTQVFGFAQVARLAVHEMGADFAQALDREAGQAAAQGVTVFQVWLNAGRPWVGWAVERLRERGYFLGGPLPRWFDDDGLLMQRLLDRPHWESITTMTASWCVWCARTGRAWPNRAAAGPHSTRLCIPPPGNARHDVAEIDALKIAPGQEVSVELMRPEDAPGVAALFRAVYGEEYPVKTYYQPQALIEANRVGDIISCVVRTAGGDIVGHLAMYRIAPCPKVYEGGASLVLPAYRNTTKLFERMVVLGNKTVPRFGGEGVYGEHVCNHLFTQKTAVTLGNVTMCLGVGLMPAAAYDKEKSAQGRVSSSHGFQTLKPHPHVVHLPQVYEKALRFIYEGLADERRPEESTQVPPVGSRSRLTAERYDYAQVMRITAWGLGEDLAEVLAPREAKGAARGVEVYQAWLPLAVPWVGWAVDELRGRGWFLGGVLPRWFDEDGLLMQRLAHAPDWDGMQILTERSKEIVRLVREDWDLVGGSR